MMILVVAGLTGEEGRTSRETKCDERDSPNRARFAQRELKVLGEEGQGRVSATFDRPPGVLEMSCQTCFHLLTIKGFWSMWSWV